MDQPNFDPAPLDLPDGWTRGDTIGPITVTLTGRSLEGCTARLTFRVGSPDGEIVQVCSSDPEALVGEGASTITLAPEAETATVEPWEPNTSGKLAYDLEFRWPDGNPKVRTPYQGTWRLKQDVSR